MHEDERSSTFGDTSSSSYDSSFEFRNDSMALDSSGLDGNPSNDSVDDFDTSRRSSGSSGSVVSSPRLHHSTISSSVSVSSSSSSTTVPTSSSVVFDFVNCANQKLTHSSASTLNLSQVFESAHSGALNDAHAWALINEIVACLENILVNYETAHHGEKLILRTFSSFQDIEFRRDGSCDPVSFVSQNCKDRILVTGPGSVNKVIFSVGLVVHDAVSRSILKHKVKCSAPALLETDLDLVDDDVVMKSSRNRNDSDDEDFEPDFEPELEELFLTILDSGSKSPASDKDEGYGRESPVALCSSNSTTLKLVRQKCAHHFHAQIERIRSELGFDDPAFCPILRRIARQQQQPLKTISSDEYYRAVCREAFDEFDKLSILLSQIGGDDVDNSANNKNRAIPRSARILGVDGNGGDVIAQAEDLKVWAHTWIKVMTQLRTGARLRPASEHRATPPLNIDQRPLEPFDQLMEDIKACDPAKLRGVHEESFDSKRFSTADIVKRAISTPNLSSDYRTTRLRLQIQDRRENLRPANERVLSKPPTVVKCLHDNLMDAIRSSSTSQLKPTRTVVKPDIRQLYIEEKHHSASLRRSKSVRYLSSPALALERSKKRKSWTKMPNVGLNESLDFDSGRFQHSSASSTANLTSTPKQAPFDQEQPGLLRRFRSVNFSTQKRRNEQLIANNKTKEPSHQLYANSTHSRSAIVLNATIPTASPNSSLLEESILRQRSHTQVSEDLDSSWWRQASFMRRSKKSKYPLDPWAHQQSIGDPYDSMKRSSNLSFPRSKSASRFNITNILHKWFVGEPSSNSDDNERKYKND